jgi:hypothetical protein
VEQQQHAAADSFEPVVRFAQAPLDPSALPPRQTHVYWQGEGPPLSQRSVALSLVIQGVPLFDPTSVQAI